MEKNGSIELTVLDDETMEKHATVVQHASAVFDASSV